MIKTFFGTKTHMTQAWDQSGKRLPITVVKTHPLTLTQIKSTDSDGYTAIQVAFGQQLPQRLTKPLRAKFDQLKLKTTPRHLREIRLEAPIEDVSLNQEIQPTQHLKVGDQVKVVGYSKGRGFAGVIKRWGFAGGPRTHGQSDRHRAPGSIGQGTTPGRVYKGKKMAGRYGNQRFTVKNLIIVKVDDQNKEVWLKGSLPGHFQSLVSITITGNTTFPGLLSDSPTPQTPTPDSQDSPTPDTNPNTTSTDSPTPDTNQTPETE